ncbi:MAG: hypothetical protein ACLT0D_06825 [Anaerovoracaceae bacterium]
MTRIFIDGKAGTTGLKIFSRFQNRPELELIQIDEDKRKDPAERAKCKRFGHYLSLSPGPGSH